MSSEATPRSFPYPGGKNTLAPWIIDHLPDHRCYVEPFAGSAAVLMAKPRSRVEVLNDSDEMLMRAYRTIRRNLPSLLARLEEIPYSRRRHEQWACHLNTGQWPTDDIEATARWFYLRYSQHSAKLSGAAGWKCSKVSNPALAYSNARDALPELANRLDGVQLECGDWLDVSRRYDGDKTLMNFDPPYADGKGDELYRHEGTFSHGRLADWLEDADARWIVSYERVPEPFQRDGWRVVEKETLYRGSARDDESCKEATERLVCNFDPDTIDPFVDRDQTKLPEATA